MKARAFAGVGVGLGLCGVAALVTPLVTLVLAGGRSRQARPATTVGPHFEKPLTPTPPGRVEGGHPAGTPGLLPFIPAQRTRP